MQVLKTRLYKPVLKPQYVIREKILEYLDLHVDNSLILAVAAAGFGKSVTISQWLDHRGSKYGWISLDNDCNDLRIFLDYLVSCIQITYPKSMGHFQGTTNAIELPSLRAISNLLINEIVNLDEEFVLVLDDYHLINNPQIHKLLTEILKFPSPNLKLVIISRKDPPLILSALRAYDDVSEVRMSELRFDNEEVISLADKLSAQTFRPETVAELVRATEGWIIGLKLAIQSISQGRDLTVVLSDLVNERQSISQFLMNEIMLPQTQNVRDCLYKASVLSRFCEDLLIAVCGDNEIQDDQLNKHDFFNEITKKTLFIISLDSDQIWFRFHHIFGEFLQNQLENRFSSKEISGLHTKASRWFESNGYIDEALQHAIKAGDIPFALQIIETQLTALLDNEKLSLLDRWLRLLPEEASDNYFTPNLIRAFLCESKHEVAGMEKALDKAFKLLPPFSLEDRQSKISRGYFFAVQSMFFYLTGRTKESLLASTTSLELLEKENGYLKDAALSYHVFALVATGKWFEANEKVTNYRQQIKPDDQLGLARNSIVSSLISFLSGNLPRIYDALYPIIDFYSGKSHMMAKGMLNNYLGFVYYQWNQLDAAIPILDNTWAHRYSGRTYWVVQSLFLQVLVHHAKGEYAELNTLFEEANQFADDNKLPALNPFIATIQLEIAIRDNALEQARQIFRKTESNYIRPLWHYHIPQLTRIKFRLFEGGKENFEFAYREINELLDFGRSTNNINVLIQTLTLMALLHIRTGQIQEALASLAEALSFARPGGFIRVFVDMGDDIRDLMINHKNNNADDHFVNSILDAFALEQAAKKQKTHQEQIITNNPSLEQKEILTAKEIEILKLIALGLKNKEIAEKQFLSLNSVKKYIYFIYEKLEVKNRVSAINLAKQMNLI